MKSYVVKLIKFALPVFLLSIMLDLFLSGNLSKSDTFVSGEFPIWNDIFRSRIEADVAIYGASRALYLNPEVIEDSLYRSCYNLGINGLGFRHVYLRHREYIKHNKAPKYIIFSIDDFGLMKGKNLFNEDQFLPYMFGNRCFRKHLSEVGSFSFWDFYIPSIRFYGRRDAIREAVKCFFGQEEFNPERKNGYIVHDINWTGDLEKALLNMGGSIEISNDPASLELFNDFLSECFEKHIQVIFVNTPEYIDGQLFVKNRDEVIKVYKAFAEKFKILFLDYSKDEICYQKEYFYNAQHLNRMGAEIFNRKLVSDLKNTNTIHGIYASPDSK